MNWIDTHADWHNFRQRKCLHLYQKSKIWLKSNFWNCNDNRWCWKLRKSLKKTSMFLQVINVNSGLLFIPTVSSITNLSASQPSMLEVVLFCFYSQVSCKRSLRQWCFMIIYCHPVSLIHCFLLLWVINMHSIFNFTICSPLPHISLSS